MKLQEFLNRTGNSIVILNLEHEGLRAGSGLLAIAYTEVTMLVLSRKNQQEIVVGDNVRITVLQIRGNTVRIGITAPDDVRIRRGELDVVVSPAGSGISLAGPQPDVGGEEPAREKIIPIRRTEMNSIPMEEAALTRPGPLNRIRQLLLAFRNDETPNS